MSSNLTLRYADTSSEEAMRADTREIFSLAWMNYCESGLPEHLAPFDPARCLQSIYETIRDGLVLLVYDGDQLVGGLGAVQFGVWYSSATVLGERFFYITPEYRGGEALRLILREARAVADDLGVAIHLTIANMHKDRPAKSGLERVGHMLSYLPHGSTFRIAPAASDNA